MEHHKLYRSKNVVFPHTIEEAGILVKEGKIKEIITGKLLQEYGKSNSVKVR